MNSASIPQRSVPLAGTLRWAFAATLVAMLLASRAGGAAEPPEQMHTPDDIPGQIAVDLDDQMPGDEIDAIARTLGIELRPSSALASATNVHLASVAASDVASLIERLRQDPRVEVVEPLARVHASWVPDDPLLPQQWHLDRVHASDAWAYATGRGVTVAVVDTGIACEDREPFSRGSDLSQTWCRAGFDITSNQPHANDDNGHGTHVAGTIAQSTNNGIGAAGLAFHARLLPVKVLDRSGYGHTVWVADGIRYAVDAGAHVINLSLGGARASRIMRKAIEYARSKGVVVVAAAGNNGEFVEYPAAFDGVLAVSATDASDRLAPFSSRGEQVDLAAPGVGVLQQTICNGGRDKCERFAEFSGTSMAAPHVTAAVALLMSTGVSSPTRIERILAESSRVPVDAPRGSPMYGAGLLDVGPAVSRTVWTHAVWRFGIVGLLAALALRHVRRNGSTVRVTRPAFWLAALAFGPGLLCFAPLVASRVYLPVDLLARPVPEWDILVGLSVHRWLPLANFLVPLALSALLFSVKRLRPAVAGVAIGVSAYLLSLPLLGTMSSALFPRLLLAVYALANTAICLWLAVLSLDERPSV